MLVLVGDTAQLPPVQVNPLWHQAQEGDSLLLQQLYFNQFRSVIELNENNRLDAADESSVWFAGFLNQLADAEVTLDDFNRLTQITQWGMRNGQIWGLQILTSPI